MMNRTSEQVQVLGCRGTIESKDRFFQCVDDFIADSSLGEEVILQFVNADFVCGKEHLLSAIEHAQRALKRGDNISSSLAMEIILYTAGEIQISNALAKIGISDGCENVAIIAGKGIETGPLIAHLNLQRDDGILECNETKLKRLGIGAEEISAAGKEGIMDLALEKVAMVDAKK